MVIPDDLEGKTRQEKLIGIGRLKYTFKQRGLFGLFISGTEQFH